VTMLTVVLVLVSVMCMTGYSRGTITLLTSQTTPPPKPTNLRQRLPPGRIGMVGLRETIAYMKDQAGFLRSRVDQHGLVFKTGLFFRPTVLIGSKVAVKEFLRIESTVSETSLPPALVQLHTPYSALNQKGERLKASRLVYQKVLNREAQLVYWPQIKTKISESIAQIPASSGMNLMSSIRPTILDLFFEIWAGTNANEERTKFFTDFNAGLLSTNTLDLPWTAFGKARRARDMLVAETKALIISSVRDGKNPAFEYFVQQAYNATDENGQKWGIDRIAVMAVLFIWGAYEETAAEISNTLRLLSFHPEHVEEIRREIKRYAPNGVENMSPRDLGSMKYLNACIRESLRLVPPSGGGMRMATEDIEIAGYAIPKGWVVSADPRIANQQADVFGEDVSDYNPRRFLNNDYVSDEFFPGGIGSHQCPGIDLAQLVTAFYISAFVERFETWDQAPGSTLEWNYVPFTVMTNYPVNLCLKKQ